MIHHHPGAELLLSHAAGNLPQGFALLVDTHVAMCPRCRESLDHAERIGGGLLCALEPAEVAPGILPGLLARLDAEDPRPAAGIRPGRPAPDDVPAPLQIHVPGSFDDLQWRTLAPGVRSHRLSVGEGDTNVRLMRFSPGRTTPAHSHRGQEMTLVLKGSFSDELGRYRVGDFELADPSVHHQPIADTGEDCICLIATDAPLRFDNLVGKILQPLFGI